MLNTILSIIYVSPVFVLISVTQMVRRKNKYWIFPIIMLSSFYFILGVILPRTSFEFSPLFLIIFLVPLIFVLASMFYLFRVYDKNKLALSAVFWVVMLADCFILITIPVILGFVEAGLGK